MQWRTFQVKRSWLAPILIATLLIVALAGGAAAAVETETVHSYWRGLWWSIGLITTVGFIGEPPRSTAGAVLSTALMIGGFLLLGMVSASLAAVFVRDEERPRDAREEAAETEILTYLERLDERLARVEDRLAQVAHEDRRGNT
jgi:voltage-gated potassium channel